MGKWELARYLIESKKAIDSIMFISENVQKLTNIRDLVREKLENFYLNVRVVYDKCFVTQRKRELSKNDPIYEATMREADQNFAHKDDKYQAPVYASLEAMIATLKEQLEHCLFLCKKSLPEEITLDYVPHDRQLYRVANGITKEKEEEINKLVHPLYGRKQEGEVFAEKKVFADTEDIKTVVNPNDYAVIVEDGINCYEGLQNREDFAIKCNVLFGLNMWVRFNENKQ